jgi:hypothetical protein
VKRTKLAKNQRLLKRGTAGLFFDAAWLVNGNGTKTTVPKSKGIVNVVFRIVPHGGEGWGARDCNGAG